MSAVGDPVADGGGRTVGGRVVGTDTGGTFTDLVTASGVVVKVSSDRADPADAVRRALAAVGPPSAGLTGPVEVLAHGTTVATNALLERRGATVAVVTTAGFEDVLEIARQDRPSLYDALADRPEPLVDRRHRHGVSGRLDAAGNEIEPCRPGLLPELDEAVEAVAVCLQHSDLEPGHERLVAAELRRRGHDVTASHEVAPEFREYERMVTTVTNAYLRPVCRGYLRRLEPLAAEVRVMTSAGGLLGADEAAERPVALLLSGPAGGVRAAAAAAVAAGYPDAVTFDMGGTSTDVCLVMGGEPEPAAWRDVAGFPLRMPSLDVHTIGAGGGSVAWVDPGGALRVGPRSAGAQPGPACYGRGGTEPTVTDADLVLGRIPADAALGDLDRLDVAAARTALDAAGVTAADVIAVVDAGMEQAIRHVTVERGVDPAGLALVAFGGAGPLHACALAEALGMTTVVVPARAGVLSAVGLLCAPRRRDVVRSWPRPASTEGLPEALDELAAEAAALVGEDVVTLEAVVDVRYRGQSHELAVPIGMERWSAAGRTASAPRAAGGSAGDGSRGGRVWRPVVGPEARRWPGASPDALVAAFAAAHRRLNGYDRPGAPVEVIAVRVRATGAAPVRFDDLPVRDRPHVDGPAVLVEPDCTVWIPPGWSGGPGGGGALVLRRRS